MEAWKCGSGKIPRPVMRRRFIGYSYYMNKQRDSVSEIAVWHLSQAIHSSTDPKCLPMTCSLLFILTSSGQGEKKAMLSKLV